MIISAQNYDTTAINRWSWRITLMLMAAACIWLVRDLRWSVVWDSAPFLLRALGTSWILALLSILIGSLAAIPLACARIYGPGPVRYVAVAVIEIVRATPELMIIFWIFFAVPVMFGISASNWTAGLTALSIIATAYLAEILRGGIYSVAHGQWEAGVSSGLDKRDVFLHIVLPQAARNMLPAFIAQLVVLFKTTAIVYVIGVIDFFRAVTLVNNANYAPFALYATMAVGYFVCCSVLTWVVRQLDPKYQLAD